METVGEITLLRQLSQKINAVAKTAWFVAIWKFLWIWKHCKEKEDKLFKNDEKGRKQPKNSQLSQKIYAVAKTARFVDI